MTITTLARPASRGAGRHRTPEALVFAGATGVRWRPAPRDAGRARVVVVMSGPAYS